jgi:hypothetical protein
MWTASSLRIGTAVLVTVAIGFSLGPEPKRLHQDAEPYPALVQTPHVFEFRTKADAALTEWALGRFQRAGLELPPLHIAFHDSRQSCQGHVGLYTSGSPGRVELCGFNWDRFLITPKKTLLHELGHAWAGATLTDELREDFVRFRGLNTWGDDRFPWAEQGSEQAAEIIAWALLDDELVMASIRNSDPETLAEAYEFLTSMTTEAIDQFDG